MPSPQKPVRAVTLENQFGKFEIRTGTGYGLLVPTQKVEPGSTFPEALDHYKVYRLLDVEQIPNINLKLRDQFGASEARLRIPQYFAVPVKKRHGTQTIPIHNPNAHLLIFSITTRELAKEGHAAQPVRPRHIGIDRAQPDAGRAQHQARLEGRLTGGAAADSRQTLATQTAPIAVLGDRRVTGGRSSYDGDSGGPVESDCPRMLPSSLAHARQIRRSTGICPIEAASRTST